jgi:hypothetical protein
MRGEDEALTIRMAYADDYTPLARLASLDSAERVPPRPLLVAEVGDEIRAALSLADGSSIADPFHRTAELLALLRMRASHDPAARARRRAETNPLVRWRRPQMSSARG